MLYLENENSYPIDYKKLEKIMQTLSKKDVELLIVNDNDMKIINLNQRNIDKSTEL